MDAPEPRQVLWPQLALIIIFLALLPKLLLALSKADGIPSQSHSIRAASGKYFYFTVFNVFLGDTLGGTLFSTFKTIEKNPNQIVTVLATCLPGNATYFITFVALEKYLCKTENELKEAWRPSDFEYETRVPGVILLTVVLFYSVVAPIIIPFGVLYCGIGWLVLRNQVRILSSLILYQVTMLGFFGVRKFYYGPFLFQDTALKVAAHELKENSNMEQNYKSYIDPTKPEL